MEQRVLIVEDEPLIAQDLSFLLNDIGVRSIDLAHSFDEGVTFLEKNAYQLALLDINLSDEKDGIDLAHHINQSVAVPFIFITSYYNSSMVARAKITQPLAYLLKPFNQNDIKINVEMALYKVDHSSENETIYLREKLGSIQLKLSSIKILEAQDNYTKIITHDKEVLASQTLKAVMEKLPAKDFVRTHKSFAVRLSEITMIKGSHVFLEEDKVPIGRSYKSEFQERISIL